MLERLKIATAAIFVAFSIHAAPVLTPEVPASTPLYSAAAWNQDLIGVVPSGGSSGFIAAWTDLRARYDSPVISQLRTGTIQSNGTLDDPYGFVLAESVTQARIVSVPGGAMVVYSAEIANWRTDTWLQRLGSDGRPNEPRRLLPFPDTDIYGLASNGTDLLLITRSNSSATNIATLLTFSGEVIRNVVGSGPDVTVLVDGTDYRLIGNGLSCANSVCVSSIFERIVRSSSSEFRTLLNYDGDQGGLGAASSGSATLIAWSSFVPATSKVKYEFMIVTGSGVGPRIEFFSSTERFRTSPVSVGWDGKNFVLSWTAIPAATTSGVPDLLTVRVSRNGSILDPTPVRIGSGFSAAEFALNGSRSIAVWNTKAHSAASTDLVARVVDSFDQFAQTTERSTIIVTRSARVQRTPSTTRLGNGLMTVWAENENYASISGSYFPDGAAAPYPMLFAPGSTANRDPAISVAGNIALVAWVEENATGFRIVARRMSSEGFIYYESPIEIARETTAAIRDKRHALSITSDGEQFFLAWTGGDLQIHAARVIAATGTLVDSPPIVVSRQVQPRYGRRYFPQAVWTGSMYVVTWIEDPLHDIYVGPVPPPVTLIYRSLVTRTGVVLDAVESQLLHQSAGYATSLSAAFDGTSLLLAWAQATDSNCVRSLVLQATGVPLAPEPRTLSCTADALAPSIADVATAATPGQFVIAWSQRINDLPAVVALRTDSLGNASDPSPWAVAMNAYDPSVTFQSGQPLFAYARITEPGSPFGGVARIFIRSALDGSPTTGRLRSTRRN